MTQKQVKELLEEIADLCCKASEEVSESDNKIKEILDASDRLQFLIDEYLGIDG